MPHHLAVRRIFSLRRIWWCGFHVVVGITSIVFGIASVVFDLTFSVINGQGCEYHRRRPVDGKVCGG